MTKINDLSCECCLGCSNRQKIKPKEEPTPSSGDLDVDFLNLCGEILMGKAKEVDMKRITKEMCDAGKHDILKKEFGKLSKTLMNR